MNKKLLYIIIGAILFVVAAVCFFIFLGGEELSKEPPIQLMQKTLKDNYEFTIVGEDNQKLLGAEDVEGIYIMIRKDEKTGEYSNRYLEIRFTEAGSEKFEEAIDDNENGLTVMIDGEMLIENVMANEHEPNKAKIDDKYDVLMSYFNRL